MFLVTALEGARSAAIENGELYVEFAPEARHLRDSLAKSDSVKILREICPRCQRSASELPLLLIRGENTRLLASGTVAEMTRRHPALQVINVAGQGHAPLLETGQLPELIAAFAAGIDLRVV